MRVFKLVLNEINISSLMLPLGLPFKIVTNFMYVQLQLSLNKYWLRSFTDEV